MTRTEFMQGNTACAEGAIAAGCRFFGGYPITPSTEVAEHMALRLPKTGGVFIQMEDEIAGIAAVIGASWTGQIIWHMPQRVLPYRFRSRQLAHRSGRSSSGTTTPFLLARFPGLKIR